MAGIPDHITPEIWLGQVFASGEINRGGIIKRKVRDVERLAGREAFLREVERRGFQAVQNHRHFVVFCNRMPIVRVGAQGL